MTKLALNELVAMATVRRAGILEPRDQRSALTAGTLSVTVLAFGVYWLTAVVLASRQASSHFGADTSFYAVLADMAVHHRAARFHPVTTTMGLAWMKTFSPLLTPWLAPAAILKAMFAAVGALGVWAAMSIFTVLLPRGYVLLGGILYGSSLGVWYFSGIPESKIVTATLSVLYIAVYVRLRENWSFKGATMLGVVLALACLNEVVSAFLLAIPVVDASMRYGFDWRRYRWLGAHVPVVLAAWVVLEVVVNGWLIPESTYQEGQSHFNMLLYYIAKNDYGLASIHGFISNWFFFNIVAPTPRAPMWPQAGGYFEPTLAAYLSSPIALLTLGTIVLLAIASIVARPRGASLGPAGQLLLPLMVYALVRAVFFFIFNPSEPLLFSPAVTIVHWLVLLVPLAASQLPAKRTLLCILCVLLFATNAAFMLGPDGWSGLMARFAGA
jgi:hypothetical protein